VLSKSARNGWVRVAEPHGCFWTNRKKVRRPAPSAGIGQFLGKAVPAVRPRNRNMIVLGLVACEVVLDDPPVQILGDTP
jgi:hypothetical protein